ncbi:hypothetical protein ACFXJ5_32540 [Streptomyces sp. NPDC059373]
MAKAPPSLSYSTTVARSRAFAKCVLRLWQALSSQAPPTTMTASARCSRIASTTAGTRCGSPCVVQSMHNRPSAGEGR